jgi:formate dehydrogenase subunit gamma
LAHRDLIRRSWHFRAEHHLREAAAIAFDRARCVQRALGSGQVCAQFHDVQWFKQGGGFIKSKHAPAGRFNAGEKLVFWGALGAGAAVAVSGFLLLFPFYVTNIFGMQIAQVAHSVIAILFIALILGHIYIGTLGMEGAFEAMWTGEVDYNWAKEHHDLWLEEELAKGRGSPRRKLPSATPAE